MGLGWQLIIYYGFVSDPKLSNAIRKPNFSYSTLKRNFLPSVVGFDLDWHSRTITHCIHTIISDVLKCMYVEDGELVCFEIKAKLLLSHCMQMKTESDLDEKERERQTSKKVKRSLNCVISRRNFESWKVHTILYYNESNLHLKTLKEIKWSERRKEHIKQN